jgi:hypothetical protein
MKTNRWQPDTTRLAPPWAVAGGLAAALVIGWQAISSNRQMACVVEDAPALSLCPSDGKLQDAGAMRERIAAGPGDSVAYVALAGMEAPAQKPAVLAAAARLAPNEPRVLLLRAASALEAGDWNSALPVLIQLVEHRNHEAAALVLARLVGSGEGPRLIRYLTPGSRWFTLVVKQMQQIPGASQAGLPLLSEALRRDAVDPGMKPVVIRHLKDTGAWADAYSLWLSGHPEGLPTLFNGGFDAAFEPAGFDWELRAPAPRAGAVVERRPEAGRGFVLGVRLTGASFSAPLARQYLFVTPGRYRLQGAYETRNFRMEPGLAWVVRCTGGTIEAGRSAGLVDNGGRWQPFSFEFNVPAGCGAVASLQLEPFTAGAGAAGGLGQIAFDALAIERM